MRQMRDEIFALYQYLYHPESEFWKYTLGVTIGCKTTTPPMPLAPIQLTPLRIGSQKRNSTITTTHISPLTARDSLSSGSSLNSDESPEHVTYRSVEMDHHIQSPLVRNLGGAAHNNELRHHYRTHNGKTLKKTKRKRSSASQGSGASRKSRKANVQRHQTTSSEPRPNALGQIRFGYENLMKRIEEANLRRIACRNGSSMYMSFKEKSEKHRNGLQSQLEKVMESPLMRTDLSEIAFQSEKNKVERDLMRKEQMHAEIIEENRRRQSVQDAETPVANILPLGLRRHVNTAPAGSSRHPAPLVGNVSIADTAKQQPSPPPPKRPPLARMTTHPDLLPKHDEGTPTTAAVSQAIVWKQSQMGRRRSSVQLNSARSRAPLTPQAPRSPPAPNTSPSTIDDSPLSPHSNATEDMSRMTLTTRTPPTARRNSTSRGTSRGSKRRSSVISPTALPLPQKQKKDIRRTCEELMRISPLLALTKAIESTESHTSNFVQLPKVNLHQLNRSKLAITFTEKEAHEKMESLIKDRNLSMAQKKQKLKELQEVLKMPNKKRKSTMEVEQPFSLVDTHSRFINFLNLLQGEKKDLDKTLLNELQHKDFMRPKQYVQQCLSLSTNTVTWNQMVKHLHRQVDQQVHHSRNDERRKAKKMWFNNFVTQMVDPRKRSLSVPAKHILTVFQDFIDSDREANAENFFKILDDVPEFHLTRMDVQNIVSTISRGFNVPEKSFLLYLHGRDIPYEFATPEENSKKSYIVDSAKVNFDAIFSEKDEPALSFEYPPKLTRQIDMEKSEIDSGAKETAFDGEGFVVPDDDEAADSEESSIRFDDE